MQSLEQLQQRREAYLAAEAKILQTGQEYAVSSGPDGNTLKRASLRDIQEQIKLLDIQIARAEGRAQGRSRVRVGVPLF